MSEHILVAGKEGTGKSTTAANLAAALADLGQSVAMIGYDPRHNSTAALRSGSKLVSVHEESNKADGPLFTIGYKHSLCVEAGILTSETSPQQLPSPVNSLIASHNPQYVIHDLWQQQDSGFVLPPIFRAVPRLLIVTSGEMASLQTMNTLFAWLNNVESSDCRFAGVIINNTKSKAHEMIVNDYVSRTGTSVIANFEPSMMVSMSDYLGETLLEAAPNSHDSILYRKLAQQIINSEFAVRPSFLDESELAHWGKKWYDVISRMEAGTVMDGSGI